MTSIVVESSNNNKPKLNFKSSSVNKKKTSSSSSSSTTSSSNSSTSTTRTTTTNSSSNFTFMSLFKLISLNSLVFTILIFILQVYLIFHRFKLIKDLNSSIAETFTFSTLTSSSSLSSSSSSSTSNLSSIDQKLNSSIIINALLITFALLFAILHLVVGSFRLGIYSHDNFKLGINFDKPNEKKLRALFTDSNEKLSVSPVSSASDSSRSSSSAESKKRLTKKSLSLKYISSIDCCLFKKPSYWPQLPPIGACFHLIASLLLLIAEVQINSKRIQIGQKPIGDVFSTKLDFLFGEPINRLRQLQLNKPQQQDTENNQNNTSSSLVITDGLTVVNGINEIIHSKDDFSVFGRSNLGDLNGFKSSDTLYNLSPSSSSLLFMMTSTTISLDFLNYFIALIVFSIKLSQTFWFASKKFCLLLFFYMLSTTFLMCLSYCSYEIIFKANNLQLISKQSFLSQLNSRSDATSTDNMSKINTTDDYSHDLILTIAYLFSSFLLFTSAYLNAKFGFKKFEKLRFKFETGILKYMTSNRYYNNINNNNRNGMLYGESITKINLPRNVDLPGSSISDSGSRFTATTATASVTPLSSQSNANNNVIKKEDPNTFSILNETITNLNMLNNNSNKASKSTNSYIDSVHSEPTTSTSSSSSSSSGGTGSGSGSSGSNNEIRNNVIEFVEPPEQTKNQPQQKANKLNKNNQKSDIAETNFCLAYFRNCCNIGCSYKENLISSFLFIIYCMIKCFFIYEIFVVFKFTHDSLFVISISFEIFLILVWVLTLILLTVKTEWAFSLNSSFKLAYWNWLYYNQLSFNERRLNNLCSSGSSNNNVSSSQKCSTDLACKQHLDQSSQFKKSAYSPQSENLQNQIELIRTNKNEMKNAGLLVRDDSVLLNRSSNLSSSSITEVSSLMPSTCAQIPLSAQANIANMTSNNNPNTSLNLSFNSQHNSGSMRKMNPGILNVSNLNSLASSLSNSSMLNTKLITQQFKIRSSIIDQNTSQKSNENLSILGNGCINELVDQCKFFTCDEKLMKKNFNTTNSENETVLIEEEDDFKRLQYIRNSTRALPEDKDLNVIQKFESFSFNRNSNNNNNNNNDMNHEKNQIQTSVGSEYLNKPTIQSNKQQIQKPPLNCILDEEDEVMPMSQRRSYSYRPGYNRHSTFSIGQQQQQHQQPRVPIGNSNSGIATIGEIMEPTLNLREHSNNRQNIQMISNQNANNGLNMTNGIVNINKPASNSSHSTNKNNATMNKVINDTASSMSTTDSGRDSLVDSPVNQQTGKQTLYSPPIHSSNSSNLTPNILSAKPFLIGTSSSATNSTSSIMPTPIATSKIQLNTSSHMLDTRC